MNIEQIACECGSITYLEILEIDDRYLIEFAKAILEEAAKECDAQATCEGIAQRCAEAIRKLKV